MSRDVPPDTGFLYHKSGVLRNINKVHAQYYWPAVELILFLRQQNFIISEVACINMVILGAT
jgi:hypothetical protein